MMSNTKISLASDVLFQHLDDEAVLLHLPTERYFGLNRVGAEVWRMLESGAGLDTCISRVADEYGQPVIVIRQDVQRLIEQLKQRGLVVVDD